MSLTIRRVVTGHDKNGKAVVKIDEISKNVISTRANQNSTVIWATRKWPIDLEEEIDMSAEVKKTTVDNGSVFRIVRFGPGVALADLALRVWVPQASAEAHPEQPWHDGGTLSVRWGEGGFDVAVPDVGYGISGTSLPAEPDSYRLGEGIEAFEFDGGSRYTLEQVLAQADVLPLAGEYHVARGSGAQVLGASYGAIGFDDFIRAYEVRVSRDAADLRLAGFIGPGHVSTVVVTGPYEFAARDYHKPVVVAGFEPLDILQSVYMLMLQLSGRRSEVENQYSRVVPWDGNPVALRAIGQTMQLRPYFEWRGLGFISHSALAVRPEYAAYDAELLFKVPGVRVADPKACQCGEVLKGVLKPWECKVFGTACTPETPIGTCMVSPEGACAAYYNFGRMNRHRVAEVSRS